jgi:hypothetical protein
MFSVQIGDEQYAVKWDHEDVVHREQPFSPYPIYQVGTLCELRRGKPGEKFKEMEVFGTGVAYLGYGEPKYDPNIGRKVSLGRAIAGFDKATRKRFWDAYHVMRGGKW